METLVGDGEADEYKELIEHNPAIEELEGEVEYNLFRQISGAMIHDADKMKAPLVENENNAPSDANSQSDLHEEGIIDELKIIYKKLAIGSLFVTMLCAITLIAGILNDFYNWNGITFNAMVLFGGIIGISCGWYYDFSYNVKQSELHKKQIRKMKSLLIYFLLCIAFTFIIFVIELVYFVLMPIRYEDEYSTPFMIGAMISFLFGILFWTVFVLFYIDLTARAVLKRGRIDFVIIRLKNDANSWRIWMKIYFFVIWFRLKFRSLRKMLTKVTGIHCFRGRMKMNAVNPGKVHEEDRVIAMFDDDDDDAFEDNGQGYVINTDCICSSIDFVLFCPCRAVYSFCKFIERNWPFIIQGIAFLCCFSIFGYIFAPILLLVLMLFVVWCPLCACNRCVEGEFSAVYVFVTGAIVFGTWIWIWWWKVCAVSGLESAFDLDFDEWDWSAQCVGWNWTTIFFVNALLEGFSNSDS